MPDAEVQRFTTLMAQKTEAKRNALAAIGEARLAEHEGRDATEYWQRAEGFGRANGAEGTLYAEAFTVAEQYVADHPEQFVSFEQFVTPDGHGTLVTLITALKQRGNREEATKLAMFELVRFERQHLGAEVKPVVRRV